MNFHRSCVFFLVILATLPSVTNGVAPELQFHDKQPQRYMLKARASEIDPRAKPHPEIEFVFDRDGKPQDFQNAAVDTRVAPHGKLVIWLVGNSPQLFERLSSYGLHAIQVHYANGWFGKFGKEPAPEDAYFLGKVRLEAATGEDFSDVVSIPKPDGMMERAFQFVKWLDKENPHGKWDHFINGTKDGLRWDRVISMQAGRDFPQRQSRIGISDSATFLTEAGVAITIVEAGNCWVCITLDPS